MLVISFVAWVPSTVAPCCSLQGPCDCMLYFISVQKHCSYLFISTEMLHLLLHRDAGWHQRQSCLHVEGACLRLPQRSFQGRIWILKHLIVSVRHSKLLLPPTCFSKSYWNNVELCCAAWQLPAPAVSHWDSWIVVEKWQQDPLTSGWWTCDFTNTGKLWWLADVVCKKDKLASWGINRFNHWDLTQHHQLKPQQAKALQL